MGIGKAVSLLLIIVSLFSLASAQTSDKVYIQARIYIQEKSDWLQIREMGLDIVYRGEGYLEIVTHADELARIDEQGIKYEIIHDDVSAFLRSRLPEKTMGAYRTLAEINSYIDSIIAANPTIVSSKISIGQTYEGRDMWAFKISDNPNLDEDEPEVLYASAIHSREVITPEVLMYFINHLLNNYGVDSEITNLIDNRELWFILNVNPDGYYRNQVTDPNGGGMWRKNRRPNGDGTYGVDLNRNYGYEWGFDDEGSSPYTSDETYRGTGPFSENETQAMRDFAIAHDFIVSIYYHSYSNLILWPWGYDQLTTPDEDIFTAMGDSMQTWNAYTPGPIWILYVANGGTDDWHYGEQGLKNKTFAVTVEVGSYDDNFWPPANRISALVSENLGPNLYLASIAGNIYEVKPPAAPELTLADTVFQNFDVEWSHTDTLNPAVEFELVELQGLQVIINRANDFDNLDNNGFSISSTRALSAFTSFYSGSGDDFSRYFQSQQPYLVQAGDSLKAGIWYDIETNWDYAYVEVSTDGITFSPIAGSITTTSNPNGTNRGNGITGASGSGWVNAVFDLSAFIGQEVYFRYSYYTDSYVSEEGVYFDNIYPHVEFGTENVFGSLTDTVYSFSGKAEGEYFYKVRAKDAQDQWSAYSPLRQTYVLPNVLCGDANFDGELNIGDAIYLVSFVFRGGPPPVAMNSADSNGDSYVNIADAVYLINFVFKGGPEPNCP